MLIAQTFCNIHFIYVWNCKNSRCYKKLQLLLDQSRLAVLLILFFFGQKKSFLWQIWQKRLLWLKSILCNHNSVITLLSTHEIIHVRSRNNGASNQAITPSVVGTLAFWVFGNNWGKTKKKSAICKKTRFENLSGNQTFYRRIS